MFARMPGRGSQSRARPLVERLDPRLIMDAPALPPEDDPLSPVGDPAPGDDLAGGEAVASSSCCSPCITYTVSVVRIETGAGPEDDPEIEGKFRFTAAASCNSGAPSSITVSYTLDESTARSCR